ncbi:MAG: hypothetical protein CfClM3_0265 [Methanobrevibacter sp. CfCl-M3]
MKVRYLIAIIIPLIVICSVYGYCNFKYNDNIKKIDEQVYWLKDNVYNFTNNSNNSNSLENISLMDKFIEANESWTNESSKVKKVEKLINDTKSYTFFDNKKIDHLNKCSEIINSYELYVETRIDSCNTAYNLVKTQGVWGILGMDFVHYDKIYNETQDKINKTII